ncbi:hypothetical protein GGI17_006295 [Coemansia sp. S146]|nr:hypothetical protein GGI17_006295 [Coemansia sp. S146]
MKLDNASVSMLRKYKVFEPGSHLRLQVVKIKYRSDYDSESFTSPTESLQYMYNIGSGAAVLESGIASVYSGKTNMLLEDVPYEGCTFPLVRKIIFDFTIDDGSYYGLSLSGDDMWIKWFNCESCEDRQALSEAMGLGLRECLELSQYDVGKARWHYNPDLFSQDMADSMTGFIEEYYSAPTPVNYRAVSNFMWVTMEDCIHIHDVLQGKFKWTRADYK